MYYVVVPCCPMVLLWQLDRTVLSTSTVDTYLWTLLTLLTLVVVGLSVNPAHVCSMVMVITCRAIVIVCGHSLLQCEYSPHAIHWIVGLPVPKFLEVKSFLGPRDGPVDGPGWGGAFGG